MPISPEMIIRIIPTLTPPLILPISLARITVSTIDKTVAKPLIPEIINLYRGLSF